MQMASNFRILFHKNRDSLHLKLFGDFDGNSAHELFNALIDRGIGFYQIFIDTDDLNTIHQFGRDVLQKKLGRVNKRFRKLVFTGKNAKLNLIFL
jgi:anti-anti-sigma regulatory factor